ncbi:MAG: hypothetical protein HQK77_14980 [Desulfobacterales bacterium]|nr:hypothetical protein [Desulfobacterales bacterium]
MSEWNTQGPQKFPLTIYRNAIEHEFTRFYPRKIIYLGVFIDNIYNIDISNGCFNGKFIFWAKNYFNHSANDRSQFGGENYFTVVNGSSIDIQPKITRYLDDKTNDTKEKTYISYVSYMIKGELSQDFNLKNYPFDTHTLKIVIEPTHDTAEDVLFGIDANSLIPDYIDLGEWNIKSFDGYSGLREKETDYSDPLLIQKGSIWHIVPQVTFSIKIIRKFLPHLIKEIIPLLILILMGYSNLFLTNENFDVKSAMAITGFLAAAAIHWNASNNIQVGYITAIDKFFLYSYALFLLIAIEAVVSKILSDNISHSHFWFRICIPILRIIFPIFLALTWASVIYTHV